jgi:hypothetical protein
MSERRFYVYVLEDPRDGSAFYVGKGLGLRMYQHATEARKDNGRGNRRKIERIKAIQDAGLEPVARKVAEYESEQDAFDHEADLIAASTGLTNILARGGGWAITQEEYERRVKEREARWFEASKAKLRERLKVWDEWERRGYVVTFPGLKDGDALAAECVAAVRALAA